MSISSELVADMGPLNIEPSKPINNLVASTNETATDDGVNDSWDATRPDIVLTVIPEVKEWPLPPRTTEEMNLIENLFENHQTFSRWLGKALLSHPRHAAYAEQIIEWIKLRCPQVREELEHPLENSSIWKTRLSMFKVINVPQKGSEALVLDGHDAFKRCVIRALSWYESEFSVSQSNYKHYCRIRPAHKYIFVGPGMQVKESKTKGFRFLDLAPEIRNAIYDKILTFPKATLHITTCEQYHENISTFGRRRELFTRVNVYWPARELFRLCDDGFSPYGWFLMKEKLGILQTCKTVYREALPIFYDSNSFMINTRFECIAHIGFFRGIGTRYDLIKTLGVVVGGSECELEEVCKAVACCTGLEKLTLMMDMIFSEIYAGVEPKDFPGIKHLTKMRGLKKVLCGGYRHVERYLQQFMLIPKGVSDPMEE